MNENQTNEETNIKKEGPQKKHLSTKLVGFIFAILAVAVLSLGVISYNMGSSAITNRSNDDAKEYATEGASHIGAIITGNLTTLTEVTGRAGLSSMDWATQVAALSPDATQLGYQDIAIMDLNGHAKYVLGGGEFDSAGQFWYVNGFKGESAISDVAISKVTLQPVIFDVAPIKSNGQVVGLLVGRRDPTFLKDITNALGDGIEKYGLVINSDGELMAYPDDQVIMNQTNVFDDIDKNGPFKDFGQSLKDLGTRQTGMLSYQHNGETKIAATAPIPGTNWTLIITENQTNVLAPMINLRNVIIIASLIVFLLGGLTAYILAKRLTAPIIKLKDAADKLALGDVDVDVIPTSNDEIGELMISFGEMVKNRKLQAQAAQRLADGDFSVEIEPESDRDVLAYSLNSVISEMNKLHDGMEEIKTAIIEGQLDFKGNTDNYPGSYKDFLICVNKIVTTFKNPLKVAIKSIERIGDGRIPPKITTEYHGDFNAIKNNINSCIDGLGALKEGNEVLALISQNDFSAKIEGSYQGIYAEIAESINGIHDKLVHIVDISNHIATGDMTDLAELKSAGKHSENDNLIPSLTAMIENIVMLVDETDKMARVAIEGDLDNRGDLNGFPGEYAKVIQGFNNTLDAVTAPIQEASRVLNELSQGNLSIAMEGDFKGQNGKIKDDMNKTVKFLKRYVDEISETLTLIGEGDLSQEITTYYHGDFVNIKIAINNITTRLSEVMAEINDSAGQVESGAIQISDGGQALAQGTTEQASSIQELTASIEEVAAETKRNALGANEANNRAIEVRTNAQIGNDRMEKMVTAMVEINDSSNSISKIIKVIDDIAFQTNILALNAAVEAARAGQQGKGFAVVAEEVRSLAARSAEAAKETTSLIEGSIEKVEVGTKIADETAESLRDILNHIEKVASLVGNIAQASNDQASEIAQITQGIEQVSQVVQTNSATAEESAAASEELTGQAQMLKGMVDTFKLKSHDNIGLGMKEHPTVSKSEKQSDSSAPKPRIVLDDMEMDKY
ncbi:methyl-accepting chemotaxis protein [Acetobacterium tundrae]|nr:methyl-accepting chemotaxis protein [Acetobacterium tundrae]